MAQSNFGFSGLNQTLNPSFNDKTNLEIQLAEIASKVIAARVIDIVLDDNHPRWGQYGAWNGIGTIEFEDVYSPDPSKETKSIAKPFFPQLSNYPLVNEIVLIFKLPNQNIGSISGEFTYYYLNSISIWNHPHHNAYPNPLTTSELSPSQQKDYQDIEGGSVRRVTDGSTEIDLNSLEGGGTFIEKTNIHPVLPFAGDVIVEGRFGNSIRLGNTSKAKGSIKNNWSGAGKNGDPLTIIRNGQPTDASDQGWIPITENIKKDLSSIYLTSTQIIPIINASENYRALNLEQLPEEVKKQFYPGNYNRPQIILNSGRLNFNAKEEGILLSGNKFISLSSNGDIGLSSDSGISLDSDFVRLGSKNAPESLILGDSFMGQFKQLLISLYDLCVALDALQDWPGGSPAPNNIIPPAAQSTKAVIDAIKDLVTSAKKPLLSKNVKTV
jgi:hypothetical protein